ncbi:MAG: DUF2518 family protein [Pyrinomonadaceae bacterium]
MRQFRFTRIRVLVFIASVYLGVWVFSSLQPLLHPTAIRRAVAQPVRYTILYDQMDTIVEIGVPLDVTEDELWATMDQAADEHQDDAARDFLTLSHLVVVAYLTSGEKNSSQPAGVLRRNVPWLDPVRRKALAVDRGADDHFSITLAEARQSFR